MRDTLEGPTVHGQWTDAFHTDQAAAFFEDQFDEIAAEFRAAADGDVLDIGCGPGHHSLRLARRGFSITAADFSPAALKQAARAAEREALNIRCVTADLTALPFGIASTHESCATAS